MPARSKAMGAVCGVGRNTPAPISNVLSKGPNCPLTSIAAASLPEIGASSAASHASGADCAARSRAAIPSTAAVIRAADVALSDTAVITILAGLV